MKVSYYWSHQLAYRAATKLLHPFLSLTSLWKVPQLWFIFISASTVLCQVVFGRPCFCFPSGVQWIGMKVIAVYFFFCIALTLTVFFIYCQDKCVCWGGGSKQVKQLDRAGNVSRGCAVVVVVALSSLARIWGECSSFHSQPALFLKWGLAHVH